MCREREAAKDAEAHEESETPAQGSREPALPLGTLSGELVPREEASISAPDELVAASLRRRALQSGSRMTWPRVRLPVTAQAMRRFGDAWPEVLARCISNLRPEGPAQPVEVVAVRPLEAELLALAESREKVQCRIGEDSLPAVGSLCCMQWYGDLVSMLDQEALSLNMSEASLGCWVVELALQPPADCDDAKALAESISQHLAPLGK
ncbi:unnamed protein product [Symbiodinium natans]|uniref:Uncharacterized protein n=1 Tax=Symbiodinium natans TaxID=878477 RepID=A0A812LLJ4_9DINO|nr:unnamed protein product [Symbiodinium natans]